MKIIKVSDLFGTDRDVMCPRGGFQSLRILLESDGMGYTLTHTIVPAGEPQFWHYTKHLESCYCVSGMGYIKDLATGEEHYIQPGTTYVLDKHDSHTFKALCETVLVCVFNPPLRGREVHGKDGSYEG